jgi:hypothetical protein
LALESLGHQTLIRVHHCWFAIDFTEYLDIERVAFLVRLLTVI